MRSVSIVYRKQTHQSVREMQPASLVKRSVDDYYSKLMEKEKNKDRNNSEKNEALQRTKLRTSRSQRNSDQFNILETLSIAQIALRQAPEERKEERKEQAKREKGVIMRKLDGCKTVLKGLNIPHTLLHEDDEENTQKNTHCKLKNLFISKPIQNKDTVIALSANFIIDEHYFWQDQAVEELAAKFWKVLQSYATIVWLCERESTAKKLMRFCKANGLRLDAAYLIVPRKGKRSLTVSYQLIENDFAIRFPKSSSPLLLKQDRKMIAINGLLIQQTKDLHYSSFYQAIPIIKNYRSMVHYVKVEMSDKGRLNSVIRLLSQQAMPKPLSILHFLQEYERKTAQEKEENCQCHYKYVRDEPNILTKIEEIKSRTIKYFTQSLSLNLNERITYDQCENSIQFIIGDILRRNYKIFQNLYQYVDEYGEYQMHQKIHSQVQDKRNTHQSNPIRRYRNQAYLWQL